MEALCNERLDEAQQRKRERKREWMKDNLKGRVVSLLREWLRVSQPNTLKSRASSALAIHLFPKLIHLEHKQDSGLKVSATSDLKNFLDEELGAGDHLAPARNTVFDAVVHLLISWELMQDLWVEPKGPRDTKLPGFLQAGESQNGVLDEYWWMNYGFGPLMDVLPPPSDTSSSLVSVVILSTLVLGIAEWNRETYPIDEDSDLSLIEHLFKYCNCHFHVRLALPVIKAMLLKWSIFGYGWCETTKEPIETFLQDLQEELGMDVKKANATSPAAKIDNESSKIAFSCRCQACSRLVGFLNHIRDRDQLEEDTLCIELDDPEIRKCLYKSVEMQGSGYVTAALSGSNRVKLRRGRESKQELRRKRIKVEDAAKVKEEEMKKQCIAMLEEHKKVSVIGAPAKDFEKDLKDCLFLVPFIKET